MSFEIIPTPYFLKELKQLRKKYKSIDLDIDELTEDLSKNPFQGNNLGSGCFKVRLKISSKNSGKSGGARVITCVKIVSEKVYLLSVYDKSEKEDIEDSRLKLILQSIDHTP